jgi:hypothetical protein
MKQLLEYRDIAAQLAALQAKMDEIKENPDLPRELEFENKLFDLLDKYDVAAVDAIKILDPNYARAPRLPSTSKAAATVTGRQGILHTWKNPHTGEVASGKTLLKKPMCQWVEEHGLDTVRSWKVAA